MSDHDPLEALAALSTRGGTLDVGDLGGEDLLRGLAHLLAGGLAVRLSVVGYGHVLRVGVTDQRGWTAGWSVEGGSELRALWRGLCAPGGLEYVAQLLEKPKRR